MPIYRACMRLARTMGRASTKTDVVQAQLTSLSQHLLILFIVLI